MSRLLQTRITFLEMFNPRLARVPPPLRAAMLLRADDMPVAFYRYLYEQVGRAHHWSLRRSMSDAELGAIIAADTTRISVLYLKGCPAGFFELDLSAMPDAVELAYFGLCRNYLGQGLGRWFLGEAITAAWEAGPDRVRVHTNTLDHPRALPLYQKLGFTPVGTAEETVPAWDD